MSALSLALLLLVPLALVGGIVSAVLTAVDAAQLAEAFVDGLAQIARARDFGR